MKRTDKGKTCSSCNITYPDHMVEDEFVKTKKTSDGLSNQCKECDLVYRERNKQRRKEVDRIRYEENKERLVKQQREYRSRNRDKALERERKWKSIPKNRHDFNERLILRRRVISQFNPITHVQWEFIVDVLSDGKCVYCGVEFDEKRPPTRDHVVPLDQGGSHTVDNVRAACGSCNSSKGNRTPEQWGRPNPLRPSPASN